MWKGKNSFGIVGKDGEVNFSKLERQIDTAVAADERYWTQNQAKIRAVTNKVASYEEFEEIVKASHLKPLEKGDRISDMDVFTQPWNVASSKDNYSLTEPAQSDLSTSSLKTLTRFNREWRKGKQPSDRFQLLLSMTEVDVLRVFHAEIGLGLLGEIIEVVQICFSEDQTEKVCELLTALPKCGRFDLSLNFLSQKEKLALKSVLDSVSSHLGPEKVAELSTLYQLG
eukprot:sb/3469578/